jgi:hypothetical protein
VTVSAKRASFGFAGWDAWFSNRDGTLDTQAGSHPYEATFTFDLANVRCTQAEERIPSTGCREGEELGKLHSAGSVRNIEVQVPPGLIGDPNAVPQCTRRQLDTEQCPDASQIGIATATVEGGLINRWRVYNMVPPSGTPAEFGFSLLGFVTLLNSSVRSGSDYGITTTTLNTPQVNLVSFAIILWGVPGDPSHAPWRRHEVGGCGEGEVGLGECSQPNIPVAAPFLTLPTACASPQRFSIRANAWSEAAGIAEASFLSHESNDEATPFTGCESLDFAPTLTTSPDTAAADTPAGLTVDVKPATGGLLDPEGLGTSDIENTSVTLPQGLVINPGQAAGLEACSEAQAHIHDEGIAPACPLK